MRAKYQKYTHQSDTASTGHQALGSGRGTHEPQAVPHVEPCEAASLVSCCALSVYKVCKPRGAWLAPFTCTGGSPGADTVRSKPRVYPATHASSWSTRPFPNYKTFAQLVYVKTSQKEKRWRCEQAREHQGMDQLPRNRGVDVCTVGSAAVCFGRACGYRCYETRALRCGVGTRFCFDLGFSC